MTKALRDCNLQGSECRLLAIGGLPLNKAESKGRPINHPYHFEKWFSKQVVDGCAERKSAHPLPSALGKVVSEKRYRR